MIFVDSNVPMFLVGGPHPHKADAQRLLEQLIMRDERLVTSAEVFQEILHRYTSIRRPEAIHPAFLALKGAVDEVFAVEYADVERARDIVLGHPDLSSRDALHVAVMEAHDMERILSFDRGFDAYPGITRIGG